MNSQEWFSQASLSLETYPKKTDSAIFIQWSDKIRTITFTMITFKCKILKVKRKIYFKRINITVIPIVSVMISMKTISN